MRSQKPRIKIPEHNVDHWKMLVSLGLITSYRHGCMSIAQLVQVVVASPPVGPYFSILLDVGQNRRFKRFLLAVRYNLEAQPASDKTAAMSSSVLWTLTRWKIRVRAKGFFPREYLHHADNKRLVVPSSPFSLCCATDVRFVYFHWPFSTNSVSSGPNHRNA
jgi:hypothetical protein